MNYIIKNINKCQKSSRLKLPGENQPRAVPQQNRHHADAHKFGQRRSQIASPQHFGQDTAILVVFFLKFIFLIRFGVEALDNSQSAKSFLNNANQCAQFFLYNMRGFAQRAPDAADDNCCKNDENKHKNRERRTQVHHKNQRSDHDQRLPENGFQHIENAPFYLLHVGSDARHQIPLAFFAKVAQVQVQHLVKQLFT